MYFPNSPEYKLVAIVLDVAKFSLYKPVQSVSPEETHTRAFLKFDFRNKGLDALNISKILNRQKVTSTTPAYSKLQSLSSSYFYSYSCPIASKNFQLQKKQQENVVTRNPSACFCKASAIIQPEFCYNPAGHILTGDLNIVRISKLRGTMMFYLKTEFQINAR